MKKLLAVAALMLSMVGYARAGQTITTNDGVFSALLPDGNVETTDLGGGSMLYRVLESNKTEAVGIMEVLDPNGTPEANSTQNLVTATVAKSNGTLLSNVAGTYNGYAGREFSFSSVNDMNANIVTTARVWTSKTGRTIYVDMVVQAQNSQDAGRVQLFLNTAAFNAANFTNN